MMRHSKVGIHRTKSIHCPDTLGDMPEFLRQLDEHANGQEIDPQRTLQSSDIAGQK